MSILILTLLVSLSGLFSGLTLGLLSLDYYELERKAKLSDHRAIKILPIRRKGNILLSTLLLSNVAVNSAISIFLADLASGLVAGLLATGLIVIFGEIIPQAVCNKYKLEIGYYTAPIVQILIWSLLPFTYPIAFVLDRVLGRELPTLYSKMELQEIIKDHEDAPNAAVDADEEKIILGALSFSDKIASEIMTPINHVYLLEESQSLDEKLLIEIKEKKHTRVPVYREGRDQIIGILYAKDLLNLSPQGQPIKDLCRLDDLINVTDQTKLDILLNMLIKRKCHISFVYDEYGVLRGIVTLEDVIESILQQEIIDEDDVVVDFQDKARREFFLAHRSSAQGKISSSSKGT